MHIVTSRAQHETPSLDTRRWEWRRGGQVTPAISYRLSEIGIIKQGPIRAAHLEAQRAYV